MSRWRILVLIVLSLAPFAFLAALGSFYLWAKNWSFRSWWIMAACWAVAYSLAWNWRQARAAADGYRRASNGYWLVSAVFSPLQTGMRYAASQLGMSRPWQQLQQNLLVWFYTAYLQRLGTY